MPQVRGERGWLLRVLVHVWSALAVLLFPLSLWVGASKRAHKQNSQYDDSTGYFSQVLHGFARRTHHRSPLDHLHVAGKICMVYIALPGGSRTIGVI